MDISVVEQIVTGIVTNKVNVKGYTKLITMTNKNKTSHQYGKRWTDNISAGL